MGPIAQAPPTDRSSLPGRCPVTAESVVAAVPPGGQHDHARFARLAWHGLIVLGLIGSYADVPALGAAADRSRRMEGIESRLSAVEARIVALVSDMDKAKAIGPELAKLSSQTGQLSAQLSLLIRFDGRRLQEPESKR